MNHASLFSGIGGFDLAAEWMGWTNIFNCEIEPFPQKILKHHFPEAIQYGDIKQTDFTIHRGTIDILTGGFPCQPYSTAGKRLGKNDERHLFPDMLRAIEEIKPRWVVGENVRGLVSWNDGVVFEETQAELEAQGYEVQSFILPAAGINAPHKRDRVWIVAYSDSNRKSRSTKHGEQGQGELGIVAHANDQGRTSEPREVSQTHGEVSQRNHDAQPSDTSQRDDSKDTNSSRLLHRESIQEGAEVRQQWDASSGGVDRIRGEERTNASDTQSIRHRRSSSQERTDQRDRVLQGERQGSQVGSETQGRSREQFTESRADWENFPTQSPICGGDDGIPRELDAITFPKWRKESIKGYGNAIVPQIAYRIFKAIEAYDS